MLKFPKLLRREYLNYSPIWKAYLNGAVLPIQCFQVNSKLFAAYSLFRGLNVQGTDINNFATIMHKNQKQLDRIVQQLDEYKGCMSVSSSDGHMESIMRVRNFLCIYKQYSAQDPKYSENLCSMYEQIETNIQKQANNQSQKQINQTQLNLHDKSDQQEPHPLTRFISLMLNISNQQPIDDIDLLILHTLPLGLPQLSILSKMKLEWSQYNLVTITVFKNMLMGQLCRGTFANISLLKKYLKKLRQNIYEESPGEHTTTKDAVNYLLKCIHGIISSGSSMQDIHKSSIKMLLAPLPYYNTNTSPFSNYLQVLSYEYLVFLDWLSVKILFRSSQGAFISNLEQFCTKCKFMDLPKLAQPKKTGHSHPQILTLFKQQQLCKLEIITNLYNSIMQAIDLNKNTKDSADIKYLQHSLGKVTELRKLKIQQHKLVAKLFTKNQYPSHNPNELSQIISNLEHIYNVIRIVNMGVAPDAPASIRSQLLIQLAQKFVDKIMDLDIILLSQDQINKVDTVIRQVVNKGNKKSTRIQQYQKKIAKYVNKKPEVSHTKSQQWEFMCAGNAKILWQHLINIKSRKDQTQDDRQVGELLSKVFLLAGQHKSEKQKNNQEGTTNKYIKAMKLLFE